MNLIDNISPFATSHLTPPTSPAKASFSSPPIHRPELRLKKLNLGGGHSSVTTPNVEEEVKDAMQDSPVLMRFHSPPSRTDYPHQMSWPVASSSSTSSPTTPRRPISTSTSASTSLSLGSPTSNRSDPYPNRNSNSYPNLDPHQRARPISLQFPLRTSSGQATPRGRTPQVRRARRRSYEKQVGRDSWGSARGSIIEVDEIEDEKERGESSIRDQDARIADLQSREEESDRRRNLMMGRNATSGTGTRAGVGMGMGMGPRRTAPLTLVERHAGLLSEIAKKETMVNEMRQELAHQESELGDLKKRWQSIVSRSAMMSTTTSVPSTSSSWMSSSDRHSAAHPPFGKSSEDRDQSQDDSEGLSVGEMINPSVAIEGGKKLLGQLMGSISLGGQPEPQPHQQRPPGHEGDGFTDRSRPTRAARTTSARTVSLIAGTGSGIGGGRFPLSSASSTSRGKKTQIQARTQQSRPGVEVMGRRGSAASNTTTRSDSTSHSQTQSRMDEVSADHEGLNGLGFGQALNGMVDPGGWTKKWGEVMSNPQVQAGSKRASAFFSSSLYVHGRAMFRNETRRLRFDLTRYRRADTYSLISQALPTPNLAALTSPSLSAEGEGFEGESMARNGQLRDRESDGRKRVPPMPTRRQKESVSTGGSLLECDGRRAPAAAMGSGPDHEARSGGDPVQEDASWDW